MATFNQKFIMQLSEDSNWAANKGNIVGETPQYCHKNPKTPQNPFAEGEAPTFSNKVKDKDWPEAIQEGVTPVKKPHDKAQLKSYHGLKDVAIICMIAVFSCAFPNVRFLYNRSWYYATTMLLVIANAGMGKGIMEGIFQLLEPICRLWNKRFADKMDAYNQQQTLLSTMSKEERRSYQEEILEKPRHLLFRIPTDSTYAAFVMALCNMHGMGAVLDTEIDTLIHSFAQDMGDYSVLIRKNFKHEKHTWYRKTEDEVGNITEPKFSMALSGTLDQLRNFVNSISNGFFSRLLYYFYCVRPVWQDAENEDDSEVDDKTFYEHLGEKLLRLYLRLEGLEQPLRFHITDGQRKKMNAYFSTIHVNYLSLEGDEIHASIVRLAVSMQRIAMVLTMLRFVDKSDAELDEALKAGDIYCSNKDFNTAMTISNVLIQHISAYYEMLQNREADDTDDEDYVEAADFGREDVNKGYDSLPANRKLNREEIIKAMTDQGVPESTAEKYIPRFIKALRLRRVCHNQYRKCTDEEYLILKKTVKPKGKKSGRKSDSSQKQ